MSLRLKLTSTVEHLMSELAARHIQPVGQLAARDSRRLMSAVLVYRSVFVVLWLLFFVKTGEAQSELKRLSLDVVRASPGGVHAYAPEKWGLLHINVSNTSPQVRNVLVATYFDVEPTLQYARRLRIPGRTTLHSSVPVLIPKLEPKAGRVLNYHSLIFDADGPSEVLVKDSNGSLIGDGALLVNFDKRITGLIENMADSPLAPNSEAYELLIGCRLSQFLDRRIGRVSYEGLPFDEQSLDALASLVITGDRLARDAAAAAAIRRWMFNGGRVWVMLDRTDPRVLELLLGDEATLHIVDQTPLSSVRIDVESDSPHPLNPQTVDHEVPVDLLRVVTTGFEVRARVNGWPAAVSRSFGHGSLLVTTLGPRAWMTSRTKPPPAPPADLGIPLHEHTSAFEPLPETSDVTRDFFLIRGDELVAPDLLTNVVGDFIGYSIPSRGIIFGVLGGFVIAIMVAGVWLWRRQQLERLGWIVPVLGITGGALLIGIGHSNRHEISATAATLQVLQSVPGSDDAIAHGLLATYHPEGTLSAINATQGGRLVPGMSGLQGTTRRMVWTDLAHWHWENVPQPAGQVVVPYSVATQFPQPTKVRATLGPKGLTGQISNPPTEFSDPVLVTRAGRMGIEMQATGEFVALASNVFSRDQFLDAQLLDDEQARRRQVLQKLLRNPQRRDFPAQPVVMGWTPARNTGIDVGNEYHTVGSALSILPLQIERPADGTEFIVPAPLLPFRSVARPDGRPSSQIYDSRRNEWRESASFSTVWLRFQVPTELLPMVSRRGQVNVQLSGPIGRLELLGLNDGKQRSLGTQIDPVGTVSFEITDSAALQLAENGSLRLGLNIGDQSRPELTQPSGGDGKPNYWRIDNLSLTLWAQAMRE